MVELETLKQTIDCCRVHLRANGNGKVHLNCYECGELRFCKKLAKFLEDEIEMRVAFATPATSKQ